MPENARFFSTNPNRIGRDQGACSANIVGHKQPDLLMGDGDSFALSRRWRRGLPVVLVAAVMAAMAPRAPCFAEAGAGLSPEQRAVVQRIETYFNQLSTLQGRFVQIGPKGEMSSGGFSLKKPGRVRFDYASPNPLLVVSDGSYLAVYDRDSGQVDYYPLSLTPLRIMLGKRVDFRNQARVLAAVSHDGVSVLTLEDRDPSVPGRLTVMVDNRKNQLRQWTIEDGRGDKTIIALSHLQRGLDQDPALFTLPVSRETNRDHDRR